MMNPHLRSQLLDQAVLHTRAYFVLAFPDGMRAAGTREMVYRYVTMKMGDVDRIILSAALTILKKSNAIIFERGVWWYLGDYR